MLLYFPDKAQEPWFKAKPVHNFQSTVRVHVDDKGCLKDLNTEVGLFDSPTPITKIIARTSSARYHISRAGQLPQTAVV